MKVLKFGGSSVGSPDAIRKVVGIIGEASAIEPCFIVVSAMKGVTDSLINTAHLAESGQDGFRSEIALLREKHLKTIKELIPAPQNEHLISEAEGHLSELSNICEGIFLLRELSARTLDRITSFGEIISSRIVSGALKAAGMENIWQDSRQLILTDSNFGFANVDFPETSRRITAFVSANPSGLYTAGGFTASDAEGITTTLGRGGSDYSASIFAAALKARILEIWTDVSGMMSADPRLVSHSKPISSISYQEAMELSHFGAKVIYPPTIQPVMNGQIPVLIKNTFDPDAPGTKIENEPRSETSVARGISSIDEIALLTLEGSGMIGIPGFSRRLFSALSSAGINVVLITQSSSEHSICVGISEGEAGLAEAAVNDEFSKETGFGKVNNARIEKGLSILALVGDKMRNHQGISGKMFSALGHNGINILAIAQGSSERNISAVVKTKDAAKAINVIHEEFFETPAKEVNLFIAGIGNVGKKLLAQIHKQEDFLRQKLRLNLKVVAISNSKSTIYEELGADISSPEELEGKLCGGRKKRFDHLIPEKNLRNSVFVDITASQQIADTYEPILKKSVSIVACNKIAASSAFENYSKLKNAAREFGASFLFETNVGAGLPIISTLNDLISSGDTIRKIQAVLSGTLNFVFNNYDGSRKFAEVVRQAQEEGYTEPDPRFDLSGIDVARKILILAREAGNRMELEEITNEGFLPESCFAGDLDDFYREMEKHENHFLAMIEKAGAQNSKLKYIAEFENGMARVGLQFVKQENDFYSLSGKDNAVLFYTDRYPQQPLVVKGAGAGAEVTASGVFADIIRAARI